MKKYTLVFAATYLALTVALGMFADAIEMKGSGGLNVVATLAGGFAAGWLFARDQGRRPTPPERRSFAWQALASVWGVSLLLMTGMLAFLVPAAETQAVLRMLASPRFLLVAAAGMAFVSLIYFFVLRWSFGWYAGRVAPA